VAQINGLVLALSSLFGVVMMLIGLPFLPLIATAMGATDSVAEASVVYMQIRLYGTPAVLGTLSIFGVLRGLQDMRTPLWIAVSVNVLNMILDAGLVFGFGPIPAFGIAGAAWASVISQWMGALWALWIVHRRIGWPERLHARDAGRLIQVGGDLFIRTGLLTLFLLLATRSATRISAESGAAHQAIRQVWIFTALALDAFAITGQSLVGYFLGADWIDQARRVARVVGTWSLGTGVVLGVGMWLGRDLVIQLLVPASAVVVFGPAWLIAILVQPLNALTFATDGIHWGTGDYRFLRNAVVVATVIGVLGLVLVDETQADALTHVWIVLDLWVLTRAGFGIARIWPGIGNAPLGS
jgi:MATE family multidrug resistance protein